MFAFGLQGDYYCEHYVRLGGQDILRIDPKEFRLAVVRWYQVDV